LPISFKGIALPAFRRHDPDFLGLDGNRYSGVVSLQMLDLPPRLQNMQPVLVWIIARDGFGQDNLVPQFPLSPLSG
jgi:hypothetical protein